MGFFTKTIGPVFLKTNSQAIDYINKLKELQEKSSGELKEEIKKQITLTEYGIKGEESIAFELKNSGYDMYILQDICLQHEDLSAQIDYIIVTRKRVYIIECKNMIGDIEVNNAGDFIRTYQFGGRRIKEGIYSPITQNKRHLQIIKEVRKAYKGNILLKKFFEKYFDDNYKSLVVLANPKTILNAQYAKKEVKEQIVRADQLVQKIKDMDMLVKESWNEKEMLNVANFFLENNQSDRLDYAEKYKKILQKFSELKEDELTADNVSVQMDLDKETLRADLKAFRLEQSRQEKIKPYYIFNDAQLEDLLKKNPKSKEDLQQVSGFGSVKIEKYGDKILEILMKR